MDVDSSEQSSVHTSDDEFRVDDDAVVKKFTERINQKKKEIKEEEGLGKILSRNVPKIKSPFGRK